LSGKRIVTLISSGQADVGTIFQHKGAGSKCFNCEYFRVCVQNLEPNRVYEVIAVRDKIIHCKKYEIEMRAVEVIDAKIYSSLPSKHAIQNAIVVFQSPQCRNERCENYELCFPRGLKDGDRCKVLEVIEIFQCPLEASRKKVLLQLAPSS